MALRNSHEKEHTGEKKTFNHLNSKNANQFSKKNISHHDSKVATYNESQKVDVVRS